MAKRIIINIKKTVAFQFQKQAMAIFSQTADTGGKFIPVGALTVLDLHILQHNDMKIN